MSIANPHDKAFKSVMKDIKVAKEFFHNYLPKKIRHLVDLDTLEIKDNTYIDPKFRHCQSDILYQVMIKNKPAFIYLLIEHQSTPEQLMPFRSWQYRIGIWSDYIKSQKSEPSKLPLIVPMVFYNGTRPYDKPRDLREIIEGDPEIIEEMLFKKFHLIDTHDIEDEELRNQMWAGIAGFAFKHAHDRDCKKAILQLIELGRGLLLTQGKEATSLVETLLYYFMCMGNLNNLEESLSIIEEKLVVPGGKDIMTTVAEYLRQDGIIKGRQDGIIIGRQEGLQEGRQEGEALVLLRLLQRKFGIIPLNYRQKIETANDRTLLLWAERLLEADVLEEIFIDEVLA